MLILSASVIWASSRCTRWLTESDWLSQGHDATEAEADPLAAVAAEPGLAGAARREAAGSPGARRPPPFSGSDACPAGCWQKRSASCKASDAGTTDNARA